MQDELFFAHTAADGRKQTVRAHLQETAELCAGYAADFGAADQGLLLGLAHDIGKYSTKFQNRLNGDPQKVDHSTAGAYECAKMNQPFAAFAVAGHHSGLPDGGSRTDHPCESSFYARMNRAATGGIEAYSSWPGELPQADYPHITNQAEAMFYTRMLYSCLVDADFLNTEAFMDGQGRVTAASDMETLSKRFQEAINPWFPPKGELNRQRCAILKCCMAEGATQPTGMFTLTVPTGGGKTAASLAFALEHAKTHGLRRIIYVIPYTSIIEQTAEVFRKMLGAEFVLEHHSGVLYDTGSEATPETIHMGKATENWDMPIIVTTAVQFFESLFSNRPSRCRKLHNLSKSVIIFDEAQMLPLPYLRPCVWSVAQLVKQYSTSVVLCTATQPALDGMLKEFLPVDYPIRELCPSHLTNWNGFQRVSFRRSGVLSWKVLAQQMNQTKQVLCIVNSRKSAQELNKMPEIIKKRYEFVVLFDVENGNPNGDPDAGNMPRIDPETGLGIVTDVCLKRKVRNYVEMAKENAAGYRIYVKDGVPLNRSDNEGFLQAKIEDASELKSDDLKKLVKKQKDNGIDVDTTVRDWMCANFYDIRTFGAVMTTMVKGALNCGQVRGPVQIGFARSVEPIVPQEITITRVAITTEADAEKKGTEMGRKFIVPYGLYRCEGYVSANLARKSTGFSEEDLSLLWEAILNMFEHDHSAARGKMAVRALIVFEHDSELGCAPAWKLFDRVRITRANQADGAPARSYADYLVSVDQAAQPAGVTCTQMG